MLNFTNIMLNPTLVISPMLNPAMLNSSNLNFMMLNSAMLTSTYNAYLFNA